MYDMTKLQNYKKIPYYTQFQGIPKYLSMMALCRGVMILLLVSQSSRWSSATSSALELIRCEKLRRAFCFVQNGKYSMAKYAVSSMAIVFKV